MSPERSNSKESPDLDILLKIVSDKLVLNHNEAAAATRAERKKQKETGVSINESVDIEINPDEEIASILSAKPFLASALLKKADGIKERAKVLDNGLYTGELLVLAKIIEKTVARSVDIRQENGDNIQSGLGYIGRRAA